MKIKIKITNDEFCELVKVIGAIPFAQIEITDIEFLNLKQFYLDGIRKIHSYSFNHVPTNKVKTFSIDVNQYQAIKIVFQQLVNVVCGYAKVIFLTIQGDAERQILRGVNAKNLLST